MANQNAANHTHADSKHGHDRIHRHDERHGFARFVAEFRPTTKDRIVLNSITVFPENESPQWRLRRSYRHHFSECFALGLDATGDFDVNGEHPLYLTSISFVNNRSSFTVCAVTGLTEASPDFT
ncbi:MAG: hypothetical protein ABF379_02745 [Akkermansiaceae bacterium]